MLTCILSRQIKHQNSLYKQIDTFITRQYHHRQWLCHRKKDALLQNKHIHYTGVYYASSIGGGSNPTQEEVGSNFLSELHAAGLGCWWTPAGWIQNTLETLHSGLDLPWWLSIVSVTVVFRLCMFPVWLNSQYVAARVQNNLPKIQKIQYDLQQAQLSKNSLKVAELQMTLMNEMRTFSTMLPMLPQMLVFSGMFIGLRGMTNLPIESLQTGGILHVTDLTSSDPYFILPVITASTLFLAVYSNAEGGPSKETLPPAVRKILLYGAPTAVILFTMNFPSALGIYWVTSNLYSLLQMPFFKIPTVRAAFKIPQPINHPPNPYPMKSMMELVKANAQNNQPSQSPAAKTQQKEILQDIKRQRKRKF